jgi:hypothetical protein
MKLYGIDGHVGLVFTLIEGLARSGSSPSASAQYISKQRRAREHLHGRLPFNLPSAGDARQDDLDD